MKLIRSLRENRSAEVEMERSAKESSDTDRRRLLWTGIAAVVNLGIVAGLVVAGLACPPRSPGSRGC